MGSAASCFNDNREQKDQSFKRRPVKREEIERPVTKKVSIAKEVQPDAVVLYEQEEKVDANYQQTKSEAATQEGNTTEKEKPVPAKEKSAPVKEKKFDLDESKTLLKIDEVNVGSLVSEAEESEPSIKQRINAIEMLGNEMLFREATVDGVTLESEERSEVQKKIAKYNAMDMMATMDDELQVKSGNKRNLLVKKSLKFLSCAAVFEKGAMKNDSEENIAMSEVSHVDKIASVQDVVKGLKISDSGRTSPTHVAEYVTA